MSHPSLYFSASDVERLKRIIDSDAAVNARYKRIISRRDELLNEDFVTEEYANSVFSQHGLFGDVAAQVGRMGEVLGSAYLIDGDTDCARKLTELLLHLSGFKAWVGPDNAYQDVPRRSELTTADIALGTAYVFDIIYDYLTPAQRDTISGAIIRNGIMPLMMDWVLPETRIHCMDSMGHNWWPVCIAKGATALLAVKDYLPDGESEKILSMVDDALIDFIKYPGCTLFNKPASYDRNSLFYESIAYFNFGTGELLRYLFCERNIRNRSGAVVSALPENIGKAILSFAYPKTEAPGLYFINFGDGSVDADIYNLVRFNTLLGFGSPEQYAYINIRHPDYDFLDLFYSQLFSEGNWDSMPLNSFFPESGYAVMRSSWENDATVFSVRSGYTWNHAHADAGSFIIWDNGKALLPDGGCCSYDSRFYRAYFCKDEAHNVVLAGHKGQVPLDQIRGNKFSGKIFDNYVGKDFVYVGADATGPLAHLCSRLYRNFIWIDNKVLVIIDDVRSHVADSVQFLFHGGNDFVTGNDNSIPYVDVKEDFSSLRLYNVYPEKIETNLCHGIEETDDEKERAVYESSVYLEFSDEEKVQSHLMINIIVLRPDENNITVSRIYDNDAVGAEITDLCDGTVRRVWFNIQSDGRRMHLDSNNVIDGFETDAYLFMHTIRNGKTEAFLASTSYHRKPGKAGFDAYTKTTAEYLPD